MKEGTGTYTFQSTGMKVVFYFEFQIYGNWTESVVTTGKWIYPNGNYFEGEFENNKPKGHGKWHFKNGNTLEGEFAQNVKVVEEEGGEEEEDVGPKKQISLEWTSNSNIFEAAAEVNATD